ncbi:hypothetical protein ACFWXK_32615 [Streptomyces sp. NPDC059070]|uniref:hypothetical protein n=1 Tax=Streptomyces sp. NPDC059070 TaxID=3346713 RepID=UPI00368BD9F3
MAESDGFSRPSGDRAGRAGRDPGSRPPDDPRAEYDVRGEYDRRAEYDPRAEYEYDRPPGAAAELPPPDDLPGLLASLGVQLERHSADELVVLVREELERRELRAYAAGWRDAAAQYQRALDETASAARARSLRRGGRRPGQGEVIPLRRDPRTPGAPAPGDAFEDGREADTDAPAPERARTPERATTQGETRTPGEARAAEHARTPETADAAEPARTTQPVPAPEPGPDRGPAPEPGPDRGPAPEPGPGPAAPSPPPWPESVPAAGSAPGGGSGAAARTTPGAEAQNPGLVRKSRRSRVPTIPPLPAPRRDRGGEGAEPSGEGPG